MWYIGHYSLRFQQPAFQRVDFVNEGHWRRSACIDFPEGPIGKQQREPKVTNTYARHWMSSPTIKHHAVPRFSDQQRLNYLYRQLLVD